MAPEILTQGEIDGLLAGCQPALLSQQEIDGLLASVRPAHLSQQEIDGLLANVGPDPNLLSQEQIDANLISIQTYDLLDPYDLKLIPQDWMATFRRVQNGDGREKRAWGHSFYSNIVDYLTKGEISTNPYLQSNLDSLSMEERISVIRTGISIMASFKEHSKGGEQFARNARELYRIAASPESFYIMLHGSAVTQSSDYAGRVEKYTRDIRNPEAHIPFRYFPFVNCEVELKLPNLRF